MNKFTIFLVTILMMGYFLFSSSSAQAQVFGCELVDPIQGEINITCKNAHLSVSENGVRFLPHPNTVKLGTQVTIDWELPFSGNTIVSSWDADNQTTHYWQRVNRIWTHNPDNAYMQENGVDPRGTVKVMVMPNGQRGWAVMALRDLMVWNGGN